MDKIEVNSRELLNFIAKAHRHTYAAPREERSLFRCTTSILPGHKDYHFDDGVWSYHDSYAGSIRAPGREVVFFNENPVWAMSYQGAPNNLAIALLHSPAFFQTEVFPFLRKALRNMSDEMPFRGPARFKEGRFGYTFKIKGDYKYFKGRESILHKGTEVFFQDVMGGLIK